VVKYFKDVLWHSDFRIWLFIYRLPVSYALINIPDLVFICSFVITIIFYIVNNIKAN